jgi:hypothetical protein
VIPAVKNAAPTPRRQIPIAVDTAARPLPALASGAIMKRS